MLNLCKKYHQYKSEPEPFTSIDSNMLLIFIFYCSGTLIQKITAKIYILISWNYSKSQWNQNIIYFKHSEGKYIYFNKMALISIAFCSVLLLFISCHRPLRPPPTSPSNPPTGQLWDDSLYRPSRCLNISTLNLYGNTTSDPPPQPSQMFPKWKSYQFVFRVCSLRRAL